MCHVTAPVQLPYFDTGPIPSPDPVPAYWHTTKAERIMLIPHLAIFAESVVNLIN